MYVEQESHDAPQGTQRLTTSHGEVKGCSRSYSRLVVQLGVEPGGETLLL